MDARTAVVHFEQSGLLRDVLDFIGSIRQIRDPITSPDGLRQTIELILHFADLLGTSDELTGPAAADPGRRKRLSNRAGDCTFRAGCSEQ